MKTMVALSAVAVALESKAQPFIAEALGSRMPAATTLALPAAYAGVVLVNVVAASFALIKLGMAVGKARKKYGVEYPQMYAAGTSKDAVAFNCVQRGHQQALETFPTFLAVSLLGGVRHPYLVTLAGVSWIIGRMRWASLYASGGPEARYGSFWSRFIWYGLVANAAASVSFALGLAGVL